MTFTLVNGKQGYESCQQWKSEILAKLLSNIKVNPRENIIQVTADSEGELNHILQTLDQCTATKGRNNPCCYNQCKVKMRNVNTGQTAGVKSEIMKDEERRRKEGGKISLVTRLVLNNYDEVGTGLEQLGLV